MCKEKYPVASPLNPRLNKQNKRLGCAFVM